MSLKIVVLKEGGEPLGDVVIDARGPPEFFDAVILGGRELKSVVAIGAVEGGVPIGVGKYTKKSVAAVVEGRVVIRGIPISLYYELGILEREIVEALGRGLTTDVALEKLKEVVIRERRRYRRSQTLAILAKYVEGEVAELPPHLVDIVGNLSRDEARKLFEKLLEEIY